MLLYAIANAMLLQSPAHVHKELDARYKELSAAMVRKDWKKLADFMTDDFTAERKGTDPMDKRHVITMFQQQRNGMTHLVWARKIEKLAMKNGVAQATVRGKIDSEVKSPDGKAHKFHMDAASIDDWVQLHHTWKLRRTLITKVDVKIDGKPVQMS